MEYKIQYMAASAPASVAFLLAIPFGAGVLLCAALSYFFHRASGRP